MLIDLLNAMQACKVVKLFLLALQQRLVSLFHGTIFFSWLKCQFLGDVDCGGTRSRSAGTLSSTSRHPLSICVVDFSLSVTQFAPRRRSIRRTPIRWLLLEPSSDLFSATVFNVLLGLVRFFKKPRKTETAIFPCIRNDFFARYTKIAYECCTQV